MDEDGVGVHNVGDDRVVVGQKKILYRDDTDQHTVVGHDVTGVDGLLIKAGSANAEDCLLRRHVGQQADILNGHDAAGAVLRIL